MKKIYLEKIKLYDEQIKAAHSAIDYGRKMLRTKLEQSQRLLYKEDFKMAKRNLVNTVYNRNQYIASKLEEEDKGIRIVFQKDGTYMIMSGDSVFYSYEKYNEYMKHEYKAKGGK